MKSARTLLRSEKARRLVAQVAVLSVLLGVAGIASLAHSTLAYFYDQQQEFISQDGGGGYESYNDIPVQQVPEVKPPSAPQSGTVDVDVHNVATNAAGSGAAGRYVYSFQVNDTFWYAWNRFMTPPNTDSQVQGYVAGLSNPNISIGYDVGVYDADNPTQRIDEGSNVAIGKKLIFKFSPYTSDNIYWFGTGYSMDSPYGEWRANAAPPTRSGGSVTCESKDLTAQYQYSDSTGFSAQFDVYVPFVVNPPTRALGNTTGLSCDATTQNADGSVTTTCTVTGSGTIAPTFNFDSTYGKFYYRYYDYRSGNQYNYNFVQGCYGNNIPMTTSFGQSSSASATYGSNIEPAGVVNFPARSIPYPLTAAQQGSAPSNPVMSCTGGVVTTGQDVTATLTSTDAEGDQVQYGVDWVDDGTQEVNSGWTASVPSGTSQTLTKTGGFAQPGTYTIYGWAKDAVGNQSVPTSCSITVAAQSADLTAGGISPTSATAGSAVTLSGTISNVGSLSTNAGFTDLFQRATDASGANATDIGTYANAVLGAGSSNTASLSYTFPASNSATTWYVRVCADKSSASSAGVISETDENNNCGAWTAVAVAATPSNLSCTFDKSSVKVGDTVTYTATGGSGTYSWSASDGYPVNSSSATVSRSFSSAGSYGMQVSSNGSSFTCISAGGIGGGGSTGGVPYVTVGSAACTNPSATISASPTRVRAGDPTTLTYSATGVDTGCTITGPGVNQPITPTSCNVSTATLPTPSITQQSVYKITCDNGESVAQVIVNLIPKFIEF